MTADVGTRVQGIDVSELESDLEAQGWSLLPGLLTSPECDDLASLYSQDTGFRSRVVMARHSFGKGEYRYFSYPPHHWSSACALRCIRGSRPSPIDGTSAWQ